MIASLLLTGCLLLLVPCRDRLGWLNPVTMTVALWALIALLFVVRPFDLAEPSLRATVVILVGLAALCAAPLCLSDRRMRRPAVAASSPSSPGSGLRVRLWVLPAATVVVFGAVAYGVLAFRSAVSAALGGRPFNELDPKLVRWAELYGNVHVGTAAASAFGLAPLLSAVAIVGGVYHRRWWYLLLPAALLLTMQLPSRTATLSLAVSSMVFYVLLSRPGTDNPVRRAPRRSFNSSAWLFGAAGLLGLAYFVYTGGQLDKSALPRDLHAANWLPVPLAQPLLYQMGGVSAFTVSLDHPVGAFGPYGDFGRSLYAVVRLIQLAGVGLPTPQPFAAYVDIPTPFNTYTAFGDAYFDLGLAGVIVVFLLAGLASHVLFRNHAGHPGAAWLTSTLAAVLTATPLHMRLLDGDILIQAVCGWILLRCALHRPRATGAVAAPPVEHPLSSAGAFA